MSGNEVAPPAPAFTNDQPGGVGGNVPATLALTLGVPAAFGPFTPGVATGLHGHTTATVVSTAGDATLSVADPSTTNTGKLVNGTFALPQTLQASGGGGVRARRRVREPDAAEDVVRADLQRGRSRSRSSSRSAPTTRCAPAATARP